MTRLNYWLYLDTIGSEMLYITIPGTDNGWCLCGSSSLYDIEGPWELARNDYVHESTNSSKRLCKRQAVQKLHSWSLDLDQFVKRLK